MTEDREVAALVLVTYKDSRGVVRRRNFECGHCTAVIGETNVTTRFKFCPVCGINLNGVSKQERKA